MKKFIVLYFFFGGGRILIPGLEGCNLSAKKENIAKQKRI